MRTPFGRQFQDIADRFRSSTAPLNGLSRDACGIIIHTVESCF